jgi:hypothetical protein
MITGPPLSENQFTVLMADGGTGQVLNKDGNISLNGNEDIYFIFDNLDLAKAFIVSKQKESQTTEFVIYNSNYERVEYIEATKYRRQ